MEPKVKFNSFKWRRCSNSAEMHHDIPPEREGALHCVLSGPWNAFKFFLWFLSLNFHFDFFICSFWFCGIFQTRLNAMQMRSGDNEETNMKQKRPQIHWFFFLKSFFHFREQYLSYVFKDVQKHFFLRCSVTLYWMIMSWCRRINDWNEQRQQW